MTPPLLHTEGSPYALAVVRIGTFSIALLEVLTSPLTWLADIPVEWFGAWGLAAYLPRSFYGLMLLPESLLALQWLTAACCVLVILGVRPFIPVALFTCLLLFLFDALTKGFQGFANHGRLALLIVAVVIAMFPAADAYSIMRARRPFAKRDLYAAPLLGSTFLICLAYSFIGLHRFFIGGWKIFLDDTLLVYFIRNTMRDVGGSQFDFGLAIAETLWLAAFMKLGYFITTLAEALSPLCLVSHTFRRCWLCIMIPFHLMTVITMKISFHNNLMLILLLMTPLAYCFVPGEKNAVAGPSRTLPER
jgi:hypothetical protein